ncbi:1-deoxy-D-xylulose-5-phosphate reductoisomerase [uncultured Rikenella sp.]|uniref:1-deoxy-D-xylulose-5-phosphate reductoisomerase n=1 Tax=uncultured Rikenella sp. TaxID=368003 RepID=UPI00262EB482|nr:1-deoxy-D-xylulose-5-phosphate reductoisomerase [uncultured Rikenella sp.]
MAAVEDNRKETRRQRLAVLGSTGSIGTQTLEVVRAWPELFEVEMLAAHRNWELLARQAEEFEPDAVVIADERYYEPLSAALAHLPIKVYAGAEAAAASVVSSGVDTVVSAMVGFAGLAPTLAAIRAGKKIALANKETLVVAGGLVMEEARRCQAPIIPVDSEHSAIFQCLVGEAAQSVKRLVLTASGGAFRDTPLSELSRMTAADALKHPCWEMGRKITVDCATMMNKGFEVIEARWLFDLPGDRIDVVVHPQSVVHSFVEFDDGAFKAQLGVPDMRLPIQYALTFPYRLSVEGAAAFEPALCGGLTFDAPDGEKYPALGLAYEVLEGRYGEGGGCVMNAANEVAVAEFLEGRIRFTDIYKVVRRTLEASVSGGGLCQEGTVRMLESYEACDARTRDYVRRELLPEFVIKG